MASLDDPPPDPRHTSYHIRPGRRRAQRRGENLRGALVPLVVGLFIGVIFVSVFVAAFHDPKPRNLPVAVVAPPQVVTILRAQAASNGDAFDIRSYPTAAAARSAVTDRTVFGAFVVDVQGPTLLVAGANGARSG